MKPKLKTVLAAVFYLPVIFFLLLAVYQFRAGKLLFKKEAENQGLRTGILKPGSAILFLDYSALEKAAALKSFKALNCSAGWLNPLNQELGAFSVSSLFALDAEILKGRRLAVIPRGVLPSPSQLKILKEFVKNGGILIAELPDQSWEIEFGFSARAPENPTPKAKLKFTFIHPQILDPKTCRILQQTPLFTEVFTLNLSSDCFTAAEINRRTALAVKPLGQGFVLVLAFDFARELLCLQQGVPRDNFSLMEKRGKLPGILESQDLVCDPSLSDNPYPFADLLERFLFAVIDNFSPLPRLWYFPGTESAGALLLSHDEEKKGGKALLSLASEEEKIWGRASYFIIPDQSLEKRFCDSQTNLARELYSRGFDPQLHWDRFNLFLSLPEQKERLEKLLNREVTACRIHYLNWGTDYTAAFRKLAACGIKIDSSYGPNCGKGYLFGTGLPFNPLDKNGLPFPLLELPLLLQEDWNGADQAYLHRLFKESGENFHSALVLLYHPHKIIKTPAGKALWLNCFNLARENRHWVTDFSELLDFWQKRENLEVYSEFTPDKKLKIKAFLPPLPPGAEKFALMLPEEGMLYRLKNINNGKSLINCGQKVRLFPLSPGENRITLQYQVK